MVVVTVLVLAVVMMVMMVMVQVMVKVLLLMTVVMVMMVMMVTVLVMIMMVMLMVMVMMLVMVMMVRMLKPPCSSTRCSKDKPQIHSPSKAAAFQPNTECWSSRKISQLPLPNTGAAASTPLLTAFSGQLHILAGLVPNHGPDWQTGDAHEGLAQRFLPPKISSVSALIASYKQT